MRYSFSAKTYPLRRSYYYRIIRSLCVGLNPSSETISIAAVEEVTYRQSRLCRLLGNPVAFAVVSLLASGKDLSTGEIARAIGRSLPRTSNILGALRLAEVVRYESEGRYARYRLKHPRKIRRVLEALSGFVKTTSVTRS
jgi:DNA-binding transcriptional ArsR family regulator